MVRGRKDSMKTKEEPVNEEDKEESDKRFVGPTADGLAGGRAVCWIKSDPTPHARPADASAGLPAGNVFLLFNISFFVLITIITIWNNVLILFKF